MKRPTSVSEALRIAKTVKRKKYAWGGGADIPPMEDPRNWLELGGEKPISPTVDQRLGIGTDAGETIVQPLGGQGMVPAAQNPRINMNFKDVTDRVPQLTTAAQKVDAGQMSSKEYQSLVNQHKPVSPWEFVPKPATYDELRASLKDKQQPNIGKGAEIPEGHPVGLRLDIPAYTRFGTWAPTIHDRSSSKSTVMAHEPVAMVNNATFTLPQNKAMGVATGTAKNPFATIDGKWSSTTPEQAMVLANAAMKNPDWRQVGMDPERHSFFYDRHTQAPIVAAEKVIQVGPLVLAHKPTYGKPEDFKYKNGGGVDETLRLARKRYATGGNPSYGDTVYEQLLKDIAAQKAKALPEVPELRRDTPQSITPGTKPAEVKHDLGGYEPVAEPVVRQPPTGAGGGGDGLSGSYGPGTSTPSGIMSSTSTAAAPPAGATPGVTGTPGFSFNGAPIGAVEAYDLPAPAPSAPLTTHAVTTTSVAPAPGQFGDMYTGQPAAQNNATQNNAAANQAALGAQVGAQVGAALNTIGTMPAATPPAAAPAPVGVSPSASQMAAAKSSLAAALQAQNAPPAMQPGVQQPSFVAPPAFTNPADLGPDVPSSMIGPAPGVDNVSNYSYGQLAAQNEAAQNAVDAVAAGLPSAPAEASTAPAAPAAAAPAAPAAPMGMSISEASPATMAAMAAATRGASIASPEDEAQAEAEAQAQAEAEAANAVEADSAMAGTMDDSDNSDSMGGLGGGYGDGDSGGGSYGDGDSGGGDSGGGDSGGGDGGGGDGGGGGGEKRGGLVKWKYHPVGRKSGGMVGKALAISDKRLYKMRDHKDWSEHKNFDETGGKLSQMSPDEFLKKSKPLNMDHDDKHIIHHFKKKLEHGHKLDPLALYSGGGQDGRHRAHAAKQLGINKIPVITWPSKAHGGSIVDRALVVTSKKANRQPGRR